jgi:uncharacterized membrane protein
MIALPPIPSWQGLHPLVVHFPIALLLTAPLFIVIGALRKRGGSPFLIAALILMTLGTAGTFLAAATGEAAGRIAERTPEISAVLERHEELAEITRITFSALTAVFAAIVLVPRILPRAAGRVVSMALPLVFLVLYAAGTVVLANTAHNGGRLVHEFGVKAIVASNPVASAAPEPGDRD